MHAQIPSVRGRFESDPDAPFEGETLWFYIPQEYFRSAQVEADSITESDSVWNMLEQHVSWRGKRLRSKSWYVRCKKAHWARPLGVLGSLAELGFDAEWGVYSAADCGAPHLHALNGWIASRQKRGNVSTKQSKRNRRFAFRSGI